MSPFYRTSPCFTGWSSNSTSGCIPTRTWPTVARWEQEGWLSHSPRVVLCQCICTQVEPGPKSPVPATYKQSGTTDPVLLKAPLNNVFPGSQLLTKNLKNKIKTAHRARAHKYQIKASRVPSSPSSSENVRNGR